MYIYSIENQVTQIKEIMFTINKKYGIGEVIEVTDTLVKVYFADEDLEKSLLKSFTTIYTTIEEAQVALNPEMTEGEASLRMSDMAEEKRVSIEGAKAQSWIEDKNREIALNQIKNLY